MIKEEKNLLHADITDKIIASAYDVYNKLGFGFSEKIYENAMMIKLSQKNLPSIQQAPINVHFEGQLVGEYFADILVDNKIIVKLKAVSSLQKLMKPNWSIILRQRI
jgi:GxxExxY protein